MTFVAINPNPKKKKINQKNLNEQETDKCL